MSDKLKKCPFCGGEAHIDERKSYDGDFKTVKWYSVICSSMAPCLQMAEQITKQEAILAWNTRKPVKVEDLKEIISRYSIEPEEQCDKIAQSILNHLKGE